MDLTREIIFAVVEIFGVLAIGWLARWTGHVREEDLNRWSRFVLDFMYPLMLFNTIIKDFDPDRLGEVWPLPVLGLGMIAFGALAGYGLRYGLKSRDPDVRKTFHHFCAINNYGFLPIIIIGNLWGGPEVALLFFLFLGCSVGYWTLGVGLLGGSNLKQALKSMLTPALVALFLALTLSISGLSAHVPGILVKLSGTVGAAALPLMLLVIGASMYGASLMRYKRDLTYLTFVRLILLPALIILIIQRLPLSNTVYNILLIVSLMPAPVTSTILVRRHGGSPDFAVAAAVVTTLASILTIPIGCMLLRVP